jgi:hypothetical protein
MPPLNLFNKQLAYALPTTTPLSVPHFPHPNNSISLLILNIMNRPLNNL